MIELRGAAGPGNGPFEGVVASVGLIARDRLIFCKQILYPLDLAGPPECRHGIGRVWALLLCEFAPHDL